MVLCLKAWKSRSLPGIYLINFKEIKLIKKIYNKIYSKFITREKNFESMLISGLKDKQNFIDVGTNDLKESIIASNYKKLDIHIFEPDPRNIKIIKKKLSKISNNNNNYFLNENCAVSNSESYINLFLNKKNSNLNSIVKNIKEDSSQNYIKVKSIKLDNYIKEYKLKNFLIKADIEGGEQELLEGCLNVLEHKSNISILLELHPEKYNLNKIKKLFYRIFTFGYVIEIIESAACPIPKFFQNTIISLFRLKIIEVCIKMLAMIFF